MMRIFVLLALFLLACSSKELSRDELIEFVSDADNGILKHANSNGYDIELQYQPIDLLFADELDSKRTDFVQKRDSLKNAYRNFYYFKLSISKGQQSIERYFAASPDKYKLLIAHLTSTIGADFRLTCGNNTMPVFDIVYTPFYGTSQTTNVMLVFEGSCQIKEGIKVLYQDSFFGCGLVEFNFDGDALSSIPSLK